MTILERVQQGEVLIERCYGWNEDLSADCYYQIGDEVIEAPMEAWYEIRGLLKSGVLKTVQRTHDTYDIVIGKP